jgi:hypothetical protein
MLDYMFHLDDDRRTQVITSLMSILMHVKAFLYEYRSSRLYCCISELIGILLESVETLVLIACGYYPLEFSTVCFYS